MANDFQGFTPEWLEQYKRKLANFAKRPSAKSRHTPRKPTPKAPPRARTGADGALTPYSAEAVAVPFRAYDGKQTETEKRYNRDILHGAGRFEAVCLYLPGGGRYTPDFMTVDGGQVTFHEVKGSYRLGSQGRAHTAFQEAAAAFPMWRFVWATERAKRDGGGFDVKRFNSTAMSEVPN